MDAMSTRQVEDIGARVATMTAGMRATGLTQDGTAAEMIDGLWAYLKFYIHNIDALSIMDRHKDREIDLLRDENRTLLKRARDAEALLLQEKANTERVRQIAARYREKLGEDA